MLPVKKVEPESSDFYHAYYAPLEESLTPLEVFFWSTPRRFKIYENRYYYFKICVEKRE